jgi:hypothetical protein
MKFRIDMIDESAGHVPNAPAYGQLRLVSDRPAAWEWESFNRRMPRARDRLGPLAPWKPKRRKG